MMIGCCGSIFVPGGVGSPKFIVCVTPVIVPSRVSMMLSVV